ncbi:MAG: DMT family transporter [Alphaproteobacteria bacterium]|nr:DMT family transporter [Alphaproteobacteria bacterium]
MTAFSATDGLSKWMVMAAPILEIVAIRNALVLLMILPALGRAGGLRALATRRPWAHVLRAGTSIGALVTFFAALRELPLATSIAISFASPLFMTVGSVFLLGERVGWHRWLAVVVGFAGVVVIAWPDAGGMISLPAALMLLSSLFFALSMITVRWLARTETDIAMLFYQNVGMMLAGVAGLPFVWQTPRPVDLGVIAAMAVTLVIGQVFMIRAFRIAPVSVVAPFEYLELLWASLIGYVVWSEEPAAHVWVGAAIVVVSGLYITWREARASRRAAAPRPAAAAVASSL